MPQESIREIRGCGEEVLKELRERKTPSAIVERQMLPRQTKRTETFLGLESGIVVLWFICMSWGSELVRTPICLVLLVVVWRMECLLLACEQTPAGNI